MWQWFKEQNATVKGMVIVGILLIIGIVIRWGYVSNQISDAVGGLFERPQQEQSNGVSDENTDS